MHENKKNSLLSPVSSILHAYSVQKHVLDIS